MMYQNIHLILLGLAKGFSWHEDRYALLGLEEERGRNN